MSVLPVNVNSLSLFSSWCGLADSLHFIGGPVINSSVLVLKNSLRVLYSSAGALQ